MRKVTVLPGTLVTPPWLQDHVKAVQIVDIRDSLNSLSVNFGGLRQKHAIDGKTIDFMLPTAKEFGESMQAVQLEQGKPIVIVPMSSSK